jgi:hypothetical protein
MNLLQLLSELRGARSEDARWHGARRLRAWVRQESRSGREWAATQLFNRLYELLGSPDVGDKLGACTAIYELVDEPFLGDSETKALRFAGFLRGVPANCADAGVLKLTARTLGHLARSVGNYQMVADFADYEIKRALAWLASDAEARVEARKLSAAYTLRELCEAAPTHFYPHLNACVSTIWNGLTDPAVHVREATTKALSSALALAARRRSRNREAWLAHVFKGVKQILATAPVDSTTGGPPGGASAPSAGAAKAALGASGGGGGGGGGMFAPVELVHGALLALSELLQHGGPFMAGMPAGGAPPPAAAGGAGAGGGSRFHEACDLVLRYRDARHPLVRRTVVVLLPRLAHYYPDAFLRGGYAQVTLAQLLGALRDPRQAAERGTVFVACGRVALAMGAHMSAAPPLRPLLERLVGAIREGLTPSPGAPVTGVGLVAAVAASTRAARARPFVPEALTCIAMTARAVGPPLMELMYSLIDPMFAGGLGPMLTEALQAVAGAIPGLRPLLQERLLHELALILAGRPFVPPFADTFPGVFGEQGSAAETQQQQQRSGGRPLTLGGLLSHPSPSLTGVPSWAGNGGGDAVSPGGGGGGGGWGGYGTLVSSYSLAKAYGSLGSSQPSSAFASVASLLSGQSASAAWPGSQPRAQQQQQQQQHTASSGSSSGGHHHHHHHHHHHAGEGGDGAGSGLGGAPTGAPAALSLSSSSAFAPASMSWARHLPSAAQAYGGGGSSGGGGFSGAFDGFSGGGGGLGFRSGGGGGSADAFASHATSADPLAPVVPATARGVPTDVIALALHTLGTFDFSGVPLLPFAREAILLYLDDPSPIVRLEAGMTCCRLLVRPTDTEGAGVDPLLDAAGDVFGHDPEGGGDGLQQQRQRQRQHLHQHHHHHRASSIYTSPGLDEHSGDGTQSLWRGRGRGLAGAAAAGASAAAAAVTGSVYVGGAPAVGRHNQPPATALEEASGHSDDDELEDEFDDEDDDDDYDDDDEGGGGDAATGDHGSRTPHYTLSPPDPVADADAPLLANQRALQRRKRRYIAKLRPLAHPLLVFGTEYAASAYAHAQGDVGTSVTAASLAIAGYTGGYATAAAALEGPRGAFMAQGRLRVPRGRHGARGLHALDGVSQVLGSLAAVIGNGPTRLLIGQLLQRLLMAAVTDTNPAVRFELLCTLDGRFDALLVEEDNLRLLVQALHDENYACREAALGVLGRLAPRNPGLIFPQLRRLLVTLMGELEHPDAHPDVAPLVIVAAAAAAAHGGGGGGPLAAGVPPALDPADADVTPGSGLSTSASAGARLAAHAAANAHAQHAQPQSHAIALASSSSSSGREHAARMLGLLIRVSQRLVAPYAPMLLRALLPHAWASSPARLLSIADEAQPSLSRYRALATSHVFNSHHPEVLSSCVLTAIGELSAVGADSLMAFLPVLLPLVVEGLSQAAHAVGVSAGGGLHHTGGGGHGSDGSANRQRPREAARGATFARITTGDASAGLSDLDSPYPAFAGNRAFVGADVPSSYQAAMQQQQQQQQHRQFVSVVVASGNFVHFLEVAVRALGTIVENTGHVIVPYLDHPQLLHLLLALLSRAPAGYSSGGTPGGGGGGGARYSAAASAPSSSADWTLRREVQRTIGILGALDPYRYRMAQLAQAQRRAAAVQLAVQARLAAAVAAAAAQGHRLASAGLGHQVLTRGMRPGAGAPFALLDYQASLGAPPGGGDGGGAALAGWGAAGGVSGGGSGGGGGASDVSAAISVAGSAWQLHASVPYLTGLALGGGACVPPTASAQPPARLRALSLAPPRVCGESAHRPQASVRRALGTRTHTHALTPSPAPRPPRPPHAQASTWTPWRRQWRAWRASRAPTWASTWTRWGWGWGYC